MTEAELKQIEARAEAATPGPWAGSYEESSEGTLITVSNDYFMVCPEVESGEDAEFIAHAREDIPALLAMVNRPVEITDDMVARAAATYSALLKNRVPYGEPTVVNLDDMRTTLKTALEASHE